METNAQEIPNEHPANARLTTGASLAHSRVIQKRRLLGRRSKVCVVRARWILDGEQNPVAILCVTPSSAQVIKLKVKRVFCESILVSNVVDHVGDVKPIDARSIYVVRVGCVRGTVVGVLEIENGAGLVTGLLVVTGYVLECYDVVAPDTL